MYKETDGSGQFQLDCRLSSERDMEENVNVIVGFAADIRKEEMGEAKVKNRHEGYGFLADAHQALTKAMKGVKDGMADLLNALPSNDAAATDKTEAVANALAETIVAAVKMAAEAKRVSGDLYAGGWETAQTPMEEYLDGFEEPEQEAEDAD
ncbi:MAG: hypothetical protein IJS41_03940 [Clostridia bacterium]|nr:hypothetical protein [Clostridia bacterium]